MKVLIFMTQFYQLSGAERLSVELAKGLNKRGIHADILIQGLEEHPGVAEVKEALLQRGVPNVYFLNMKPHPPIASVIPAILRLRRLIREEEYDIVETSSLSPSVLMCWANWGLRSKHVEGLHHVFRRDHENGWRHKFWKFSVRCNKNVRYYAASDYAAKQWIKYSKTHPEHTCTIYNGILDECFDTIPDRAAVRKEFGIPSNGRIAIYAGRLVPYKGIENILEALGPVLRKNNLYLLYVGRPDWNIEGTGTAIQRMKQKIQQERWTHHIRFLGYRKDICRLLASSDVLVHPAQIEAFGLVIAEAMAAGLPVVASNVQGIPEVLRGTDSIMVLPDNLDALREAVLMTLRRPPDEADSCIRLGWARAKEFSMEKRIDNMILLFQEVLGKD